MNKNLLAKIDDKNKMDKDNDQNQNNPSPSAGEKSDMGGTLDMKGISVSTLDDDMKKKNPEKATSNWFGFLSKHQTGDQVDLTNAEVKNGQNESDNAETEEINSQKKSFLEQEMDQFKQKISTEKTEENLINDPKIDENEVSDGEISDVNSEEDSDEDLNEPLPSLSFGENNEKQETETEETAISAKEGASSELETVSQSGSVNNVNQIVKNQEQNTAVSEEETTNPFGAKIKSPELEKKSLLSSVESALNYSASPEFAESREKIEEALREEQEQSKVVDLRKKEDQMSSKIVSGTTATLGGQKMWLIGGGILGLAALLIGGLVWFSLSGSSAKKTTNSQNMNNNNKNSASQSNSNFSVKPTVQINTAISPKKILDEVKNISIKDSKEIANQIDTIKQDKTLSGQTQIIFLKPDGSAISFEELMDSLNFSIPSRILPEPSKEPALIFADSFQGKRIFGLIIPTTEDTKTVLDKMKVWESTLTSDLTFLWDSTIIDNRGAYFADTTLFKNSRYAIIDKKTGLSMNYSINNGYIFITCGKDSMSYLEKNFNASASDSGFNSNSNANSNANSGFDYNGNSNVSGLNNDNTATVTPFGSQ